MRLEEPIDILHGQCLAARDAIRHQFAALRAKVSRWEPSPPPTKGTP